MCTTLEDAWHTLKNENPNYLEEALQIEDINSLSIDNNFFISLNYTKSNLLEIEESFNRKIGFVLIEKNSLSERVYDHTHTSAEVNMLTYIRANATITKKM